MAYAPGRPPAGGGTVERREAFTIGTTAVIILRANKKRTEYRVTADPVNSYRIFVGKNADAGNTPIARIPAGHTLVDSGNQDTIYRGELWGVADGTGQLIVVEEMIKR